MNNRAMRQERAAERAAHRARMEALRTEARRIVATGTCPDCGTALVRNTALAGWWQCGAYATEAFRQPAYRGLPSCHFQTFTDFEGRSEPWRSE